MLDTGCCGMAGSFGFKQEHYDISMQIGELALLPAIRNTATDTIVISDGFSCRQQIEQSTHRQGMHLAEVIHQAMGNVTMHVSASAHGGT